MLQESLPVSGPLGLQQFPLGLQQFEQLGLQLGGFKSCHISLRFRFHDFFSLRVVDLFYLRSPILHTQEYMSPSLQTRQQIRNVRQ